MDAPTTLRVLGTAERDALISLTLHNQLEEAGHEDWARLAWAIHLGASRAADTLGASLGLSD